MEFHFAVGSQKCCFFSLLNIKCFLLQGSSSRSVPALTDECEVLAETSSFRALNGEVQLLCPA